MLTGRVFVPVTSAIPESSVPHSTEFEEEEEEEREARVPSIVIEIHAPKPLTVSDSTVTPQPLPVKRISEPEVHVVDVVPPRETLEDVGETDEVRRTFMNTCKS